MLTNLEFHSIIAPKPNHFALFRREAFFKQLEEFLGKEATELVHKEYEEKWARLHQEPRRHAPVVVDNIRIATMLVKGDVSISDEPVFCMFVSMYQNKTLLSLKDGEIFYMNSPERMTSPVITLFQIEFKGKKKK